MQAARGPHPRILIIDDGVRVHRDIMIHRGRDYPKEWTAASLDAVPADKHPLLPSPDGALQSPSSPAAGLATASQNQAPKATKAVEKPPQTFIDPLQAFAAEKDVDDDPLGALARGAGKAVVDNTPIGVVTKVDTQDSARPALSSPRSKIILRSAHRRIRLSVRARGFPFEGGRRPQTLRPTADRH